MFRIKIALLVGGIALGFYGFQEWRLAQGAKATPQAISCADLAAKGPGDNAYITLTDYLMCEQAIVYESKKNNPKWNAVWVPTVPIGGEYHQKLRDMMDPDGKINGPLPVPQDIKVLVKSKKIDGTGQLRVLADQPTMTGLVTNTIESLGSKQKAILESNYPGIDFAHCWIVDHDRTPAGLGQVGGMIGGGAVLALIGLGWMLTGSRSAGRA